MSTTAHANAASLILVSFKKQVKIHRKVQNIFSCNHEQSLVVRRSVDETCRTSMRFVIMTVDERESFVLFQLL